MGAQRKLCENIVASTVVYFVETFNVVKKEQQKFNVMEEKYPSRLRRVSRMDKVNNGKKIVLRRL